MYASKQYGAELRGKQLAAYLSLLALYVVILCIAGWLMQGQETYPQAPDPRTGRRICTVMALIETAVVVCLAPLLTVNTLGEYGQHRMAPLLLSPLGSGTVVRRTLALPVALMGGVVVASAVPVGYQMGTLGGVGIVDMLVTYGLQCSFALSFLSVGLLCATLFREVYTAVGVAYLTIIGASGGVIFAAPLIRRLADANSLIQTVLLANPFIGVSSALSFDILRTEWLYRLSPIGQRQFVYPAWYEVGACTLLSAGLMIAGTIWRVAHLRRNIDRWRR